MPTTASLVLQALQDWLLDGEHVRLELRFCNEYCKVSLPTGVELGTLSRGTSAAFARLWSLQSRLAPYASLSDLTKALVSDTNRKGSSKEFQIKVNVYGSKGQSSDVRSLLEEEDIFLQDPDWKEDSMPYRNPQVLTFAELSEAELWLKETRQASSAQHTIENEMDWAVVLDCLPQHEGATVTTEEASLKAFLQE